MIADLLQSLLIAPISAEELPNVGRAQEASHMSRIRCKGGSDWAPKGPVLAYTIRSLNELRSRLRVRLPSSHASSWLDCRSEAAKDWGAAELGGLAQLLITMR